MRIWRYHMLNIVGDLPLIVGGACAAIGTVLLLSDILMQMFGK